MKKTITLLFIIWSNILLAQVKITGNIALRDIIELQGIEKSDSINWYFENEKNTYHALQGMHSGQLILSPMYENGKLQAIIYKKNGNIVKSDEFKVGKFKAPYSNDWFKNSKYGLSHTFDYLMLKRVAKAGDRLKTSETWDDVINQFDVDAYVKQVQESGAGFVLFALGQNSGYYCSPNAVYEKYTGYKRGFRTPHRDLPMEIGKKLAKKGIRFMLYLSGNPPRDDQHAQKSFHYPYYPGEGPPSQQTAKMWGEVIREWSNRYGKLLSGWWFDGMWYTQSYKMDQPYNFHSRALDAKSGNSTRIITFSMGLGNSFRNDYAFEDYTGGEVNNLSVFPENRWSNQANKQQWFAYTFLGKSVPIWAGWGNKGLSKNTDNLVTWSKKVIAREGVICLDCYVSRYGSIDNEQRLQLKLLRKAIRTNSKPHK